MILHICDRCGKTIIDKEQFGDKTITDVSNITLSRCKTTTIKQNNCYNGSTITMSLYPIYPQYDNIIITKELCTDCFNELEDVISKWVGNKQ